MKIADDEYKNIIKNQDQNDKICDEKEILTNNLKCFYVNAKKKNNKYDSHTLNEIEEIKKLARNYPPITKIQSKFIKKI